MSIYLSAAKTLVEITRQRDEAVAVLRECDDALTQWWGEPDNVPASHHDDFLRWQRIRAVLSRATERAP